MYLRFHELALVELYDIVTQATERNPQEAHNIERAVERSLSALLTFPQSGRFKRAHGWHEKYVPRTRIKFIYRFTDDELSIIATFHTSRDPNTKPFERRFDEL